VGSQGGAEAADSGSEAVVQAGARVGAQAAAPESGRDGSVAGSQGGAEAADSGSEAAVQAGARVGTQAAAPESGRDGSVAGSQGGADATAHAGGEPGGEGAAGAGPHGGAEGGPESAEGAPAVVRRAGDADKRRAYRVLAVALGSGAVGAGLVLLAAGKTWARGETADGVSSLHVHATGSQMTALPGALALVGLASLVAVFAVRRAGRYLVSGLLALSGLGVVLAALLRGSDHGPLDSAAAAATGLTHATALHTSTTGWPYVSLVGGLLLLAAGLLALRHGSRWPAMSGRYDRPGAKPATRRARTAAPAPVDPDRPEDLWKALDRGEDPTD
jgi:uncharacterized membrane protein (TIGR02234 family)